MIRSHMLAFCLVTALLATSAAAQSAPRTVDLKAADGLLLKTSFFPATKPGPGVLLMHQCNRQRKVWDELATQLAAAGINVLTFDLRGFGESGGVRFEKATPDEARELVSHRPSDVDVAFQYLVSQPGVAKDVIGVGGASCGVDNSVQAARRHPAQVKALVLLSGGTNAEGRKFLRAATQPALFAVAEDDEFRDSVDTIPWLFTLSATPGKKFVHYAAGGHGSDMFSVHPELRTMIVDWYVTTLIKTPGHAPADITSSLVPPSAQILNDLEIPGGVEKATQQLAEARRTDPKAVIFPEALVNQLGYERLQAADTKSAVEIMKLNVSAFPDSPNAYDSLSDAYLADGKNDAARQTAKKAIDLLASDTADPEQRRNLIRDSAQQKLKQLGDAQP